MQLKTSRRPGRTARAVTVTLFTVSMSVVLHCGVAEAHNGVAHASGDQHVSATTTTAKALVTTAAVTQTTLKPKATASTTAAKKATVVSTTTTTGAPATTVAPTVLSAAPATSTSEVSATALALTGLDLELIAAISFLLVGIAGLCVMRSRRLTHHYR